MPSVPIGAVQNDQTHPDRGFLCPNNNKYNNSLLIPFFGHINWGHVFTDILLHYITGCLSWSPNTALSPFVCFLMLFFPHHFADKLYVSSTVFLAYVGAFKLVVKIEIRSL